MLPPKRVCSDAPNEPTIERERTMIPCATPSERTVVWPGRSNAVVTRSGVRSSNEREISVMALHRVAEVSE